MGYVVFILSCFVIGVVAAVSIGIGVYLLTDSEIVGALFSGAAGALTGYACGKALLA